MLRDHPLPPDIITPTRRGNCCPLEPEPVGEIGTPARQAVVIYLDTHLRLAAPQTAANPVGLAARGETGHNLPETTQRNWGVHSPHIRLFGSLRP